MLTLAYECLKLGTIALLFIELALEALVDSLFFGWYFLEVILLITTLLSYLVDELQRVE